MKQRKEKPLHQVQIETAIESLAQVVFFSDNPEYHNGLDRIIKELENFLERCAEIEQVF